MSAIITKVLIGALATVGAVQALPNQQYVPSGFSTVVAASATASATTPPAPVQTQDNTALFKDLFTAPTAIKRFQRLLTTAGEKLLSPEELKKLIVFDFNGATPAPGAKGGAAKAANIETFPILTDLGISTTMGFLDACGINTPHIHPRATEFLTVVEGQIDFGYILENGLVKAPNSAEVSGHLDKFQGTVFPMGSIHYQINPDCKPATFVATLNSEDPGTSQVAQNFFGLNANVVNATLGFPSSLAGKDIASFRNTIPANLAKDIENCLKKCPQQ
ncbi:RmlC-like cupin [Lindgomyces ingoldianus]|uniref:RmlC-like cupin n=1 Tax=Lindgomyces ingoldianus TaxID=673940 RepID=A0ACB6RFN8_9PLEO|nr:RmlC-like cupin [Lindgomyces ingoldianus]KAF2478128.1 RmlC-like cupin [Lindgomyces ingoldianus]